MSLYAYFPFLECMEKQQSLMNSNKNKKIEQYIKKKIHKFYYLKV